MFENIDIVSAFWALLIVCGLLVMFILAENLVLVFALRPVLPFLKAKILNTDLALVMDATKKMRFVTGSFSKGLLQIKDLHWSFVGDQTTEGSYFLGDVRCLLVVDYWTCTFDPIMSGALDAVREKLGIDDYPKLIAAFKNGDLADGDEIWVRAFKRVPVEHLRKYISGIGATPTALTAENEEKKAENAEQYAKRMQGYFGGKSDSNISTLLYMGMVLVAAVVGYALGSGGLF